MFHKRESITPVVTRARQTQQLFNWSEQGILPKNSPKKFSQFSSPELIQMLREADAMEVNPLSLDLTEPNLRQLFPELSIAESIWEVRGGLDRRLQHE